MWKKQITFCPFFHFLQMEVCVGVCPRVWLRVCVWVGGGVREREKEICYLGSILQLSFVFFLAPGLRWFSFHCWDMLRRAEEHLHQTQMVAHNCIKLSGFQTKTPKSEVGNIWWKWKEQDPETIGWSSIWSLSKRSVVCDWNDIASPKLFLHFAAVTKSTFSFLLQMLGTLSRKLSHIAPTKKPETLFVFKRVVIFQGKTWGTRLHLIYIGFRNVKDFKSFCYIVSDDVMISFVSISKRPNQFIFSSLCHRIEVTQFLAL